MKPKKQKSIKQFTPVKIIWRDARSNFGWQNNNDVQDWVADNKMFTIETYGHVIKADKESVVLCFSKDIKEDFGSTAVHSLLEIPAPMVIRIHELKQGKKLW